LEGTLKIIWIQRQIVIYVFWITPSSNYSIMKTEVKKGSLKNQMTAVTGVISRETTTGKALSFTCWTNKNKYWTFFHKKLPD